MIIQLPTDLSELLFAMANEQNEVNGVLFFRREGIYGPVDYLMLTGEGDISNTSPDEQRLDVAQTFLDNFPEYGFVQFHTHSSGTISQFPSVARSFSDGDRRSIEQILEKNPEYLHLLATPEVQIMYGQTDDVELINSSNEYLNRSANIDAVLRTIVEAKGYSFDIDSI